MDEHLISHFVAFTAFVQLAVAFNFGLLYLERKSSTVKFRDLFHEGFLSLMDMFLKAAGREMRRYREDNATQEERSAYYNVRDLRIELTTKANALIHFKFLQPLGMVYGIFGIIQLFNLCMLDRGVFYADYFLLSGQMTFIYGLIILSWHLCGKGNNPHVLLATFIYIIGLLGCWVLIKYDCIYRCIDEQNFSIWLHILLLLSYLPFVYLLCVLVIHYARRFPILRRLVKGTKTLHVLMDNKKRGN